MDVRRRDQMIVVQHQDERAGQRIDLVKQPHKRRLQPRRHFLYATILKGRFALPVSRQGRKLCALQCLQHLAAQARVDLLQRRNQVSQEPLRIVVPFIQRDPDHGCIAVVHPLAEQGRLAESCGRRDQG